MSSTAPYEDAVSQLAAQADAIGKLAQDGGGFAAVVAAFESKDPDAFRWVLNRLEVLPYCDLICEWVRIKMCVLRCIEVCGPPRAETELPSLPQFARAIVHLASDEKMLRRVVDAVSCGNADEYRTVIAELKLEAFCHLICRWVCSIIYRRVCEIVCTPVFIPQPDAVSDIRAAAAAMTKVIANEKILDTIAKATIALDCVTLKSAIEQGKFIGECEIICHVICSWRCAWVCRTLCLRSSPVLTGAYAIEEARNFALASRQLATQPRVLGSLVNAVKNRDAEAYSEIISSFGLEIYCEQVCAWVCSIVCSEFCICVCPPPELLPYFFNIGGHNYETQVDSALPATGLTLGVPHAFYSVLRLNGILTKTLGGQPLEYSFEYVPVTMAATTLQSPIGAGDTTITVSSSAGFPAAGPFNAVIGGTAGGWEIITVTNVAGTTWTVLRGRQSTAAAAASGGARIVTGAAAASATWTQIPQSWITRTVIGYEEVFVPTPVPHLEFIDVAVNPNPGDIPALFTPDGWIQVPQASNVALTNNMINLDTTRLPSFPAANETGVAASIAASPLEPTDLYFGIRMRVRQQGTTADSDGGTCAVVAIDNTLYNNINRHPEWAGGVISNQYGVAMLDIKELQLAGCAGITDSLTVLFTASHPNLGGVNITMVGGTGGPYEFTLPPPPHTGNWYGTAVNDFALTDLEPCAYLITLSVSLLLTTGDSDFPSPLIDQIAFCLS